MAYRFKSIDLRAFLKKPQFFAPRAPYDPLANALRYEEKTLALSGLEPHKDIQIFDVPITYKGTHYMHTIRCGQKNKEPLVLIHGYCGSLALFYPLLKNLSQRFDVYCVDLLGLGLSSRPDFDCTTSKESIDYFVDSLEEWRKSLNLEKLAIGGHSFGGYISAQYALKYANQINGLYLLSPTGVTEKHDKQASKEWEDSLNWISRQFWYMYFNAYARILYEANMTPQMLARRYPSFSKFCVRSYIQMFHGSNLINAKIITNYLFEMYMIPGGSEKAIHHLVKPPRLSSQVPLEPFLAKKTMFPIYCYYGVEDWVDWTGAVKIAENPENKHFNFKWISNSGHQLIMENHKELTEAILSTPVPTVN